VDENLQKVERWFMNADDNSDSHQNLIITFWPICNVPWNLHANLFRCIRINKLTSKKYAKTINLLCEGNKVFVKYHAKEGGFHPQPPFAYALDSSCLNYCRHCCCCCLLFLYSHTKPANNREQATRRTLFLKREQQKDRMQPMWLQVKND